MEELIKAWDGWRFEFECTYGSDHDGVTEYKTYTSYDWSYTLDLSIINKKDGKYPLRWLKYNGLPRQYNGIYITDITPDAVKVFFSCYEIELTKEKRSYDFRYAFGHGDYHDVLRLLAPGEKEEQINACTTK